MKKTIGILGLALFLTLGLSSFVRAAAPEKMAAGASAESAEHHAPEGDPQLLPPPDKGAAPAITTLVIFVLLMIVLGKYAWGPITTGLKAREDKIRKDIADAEAARTKAEATLKEYNAQLATAEGKIRDLMTKATADAEKVAQSLRMQAQQESEEIKERATREIETARKAAVADIYAQAAELSTNIASKILKRNLNVDDQRALVSSSLEQLQTAGKA